MAHIRDRAVFVVRQRFHNNGDAAHAVALIVVGLVVDLAVRTRVFVQRALDVVVGHIVGLGLGDAVAQAGVEVRIRRASLFDGDRHLTADFGEYLCLFRVIRALALGNIMPLGMSRHDGCPSFYHYNN